MRISVYLGRSLAYVGNIALVLNLLSSHVLLQFYVMFDDNFTLISTLRTNTVLKNWADLVSKSAESMCDNSIDSSKI